MAKEKLDNYDESSISHFDSDLMKLRAQPTMYIGPVDGDGVFTLLREVVNNSTDEARAGRNGRIEVWLTKRGDALTAVDEGVGIPVGKHPKAKISTLTHILTSLQSSGKMKGNAYKTAIGVHGVGLKATTALSESLQCWTYRKGEGWFDTKFASGKEKAPVRKTKAPKTPAGVTLKCGTMIQFKPDPAIFKKHWLDEQRVFDWAELTAYLNPRLEIIINTAKGKKKRFYSKNGVTDYVEKRLEDLKATRYGRKPLVFRSTTLELVLQFSSAEGAQVEAYTNTIRNIDGGTHMDALWRALPESLKPYAGKAKYLPSDLRDGLVGVTNVLFDAPSFTGQTKEKLADQRPKTITYAEALGAFKEYWAGNKSLAKEVCARAAAIRAKTDDFLKDKKLLKKIKAAKNSLPAKLSDVEGNLDWEELELILVEGDSAGGGLDVVRDKQRQAVYCLRGKPLNCMEVTKDKVNANVEIVGILAAMGVGEGKGKKKHQLRYGRVMICSDADVDGMHIRALLEATFYKYVPQYMDEGRLYVIDLPEYVARTKTKTVYGSSREKVVAKAGKTALVSHFKGLGEMENEDLEMTVTNMKTRKLTRLMPSDKAGNKRFEGLMGKDAAYRKEFLGINAVNAGNDRKAAKTKTKKRKSK